MDLSIQSGRPPSFPISRRPDGPRGRVAPALPQPPPTGRPRGPRHPPAGL